MAETQSEQWRPPLFPPASGQISKFAGALRRFFDIQAESVWNDVSAVLPLARGTILDVGCGAQPYRRLVNLDAKYLGIDTAQAKACFGYELPDTTYFSGDVWPVSDSSVDFVLCTETLEHVFDTRGFLAQAWRCLTRGGTILLTVPFAARWHFIPYDYWRFTPSSLKSILEEVQFGQVRVYARGNATTVACYKVMALILRLLMPQNAGALAGLFTRLVGLAFVPLFLVLAVIANLSLLGRGGDDCLGYTVIAQKGTT
jgi:SAM-dependent methyltransferase